MVLLNMISKLTLTVKPQSTLRTLKWVARPPDGKFIKKLWFMLNHWPIAYLGIPMKYRYLVPVLSHVPSKSFQAWQWWWAARYTACESLTLKEIQLLNGFLYIQASCLVGIEVSIKAQLPVKGGRTELASEHLLLYPSLWLSLDFLRISIFHNILLSVCHIVKYDLVSLGHYLKR